MVCVQIFFESSASSNWPIWRLALAACRAPARVRTHDSGSFLRRRTGALITPILRKFLHREIEEGQTEITHIVFFHHHHTTSSKYSTVRNHL